MITSIKSSPIMVAILAIILLVSAAWNINAAQDKEATQRTILPVSTLTVKMDTGYYERRSFTGRAVAGRTSALAFEIGGTLKNVHVDIGSGVNEGDLLATLDQSRTRAQKEQVIAELGEVEANLKLALRTLDRTKETFDRGHTSAQRLDEAEASAISLQARKARLEATLKTIEVDLDKQTLLAPYSGTITERMGDEGSVFAGGQSLLEITEDTRIEAHIGMPQKFAAAAKNGEKVTLLNGRTPITTPYSVRSVVPVITGQTRTMLVTFDLAPNTASRGALINALVEDWQEAHGAWLPLRAISSDVRGLWRVYKIEDSSEGKIVKFENVQILYTRGDKAYVTGTISDGDIIIKSGVERVAPGQLVSVTTSGFADDR